MTLRSQLDIDNVDLGWLVGESDVTGQALRGGDIVIRDNGDFATRIGANQIVEAIKRRITTPTAFYQKAILDVNGVQLLDSNYGNPTFNLQSEGITSAWLRRATAAMKSSLLQEDRIENVNVFVSDLAPENGRVIFTIQFTIIGQDVVYNIEIDNSLTDPFLLENNS